METLSLRPYASKQTQLVCPEHFSLNSTLSFLTKDKGTLLLKTAGDFVSFAIDRAGDTFILSVTQQGSRLGITLAGSQVGESDVAWAAKFVADWLDLERDMEPFFSLLRKDEQMKELVEPLQGCRLANNPDLFEAICWAIIGQQVHLSMATKVKEALIKAYGRKVIISDQTYYLFPTCGVLRNAKREDLAKLQLSRQKIEYLLVISQAFHDGTLSREKITALKTRAEKVALLTSLKGVGVWTANFVLITALREMGSIAYGDAALNQVLHKRFATEKKPTPEAVDAIFQRYKGWEAYFNFYLWKSRSVTTSA